MRCKLNLRVHNEVICILKALVEKLVERKETIRYFPPNSAVMLGVCLNSELIPDLHNKKVVTCEP